MLYFLWLCNNIRHAHCRKLWKKKKISIVIYSEKNRFGELSFVFPPVQICIYDIEIRLSIAVLCTYFLGSYFLCWVCLALKCRADSDLPFSSGLVIITGPTKASHCFGFFFFFGLPDRKVLTLTYLIYNLNMPIKYVFNFQNRLALYFFFPFSSNTICFRALLTLLC